MACTTNTPSITLQIAGGLLRADSNISAPAATIAPNLISIASDGLFVDASDGWVILPSTLAFSSTTGAGDASCYVCTSSIDLTAYLTTGMKCMLVHGGVTKFFEVVAVAAGTITLWAGSAYSLSAGAITAPMFSCGNKPALYPDIPTTAPPAVAYEGMRITMIADAANGIEWDLKFRTAEATYKWRYVGGPPQISEVDTTQSTSSAGYTDLGTVGPTVVVARAGDYDVYLAATPFPDTGAGTVYSSIQVGGTGATDNDAAFAVGFTGQVGNLTRARRKTGLAASTTIQMKYKLVGTPGPASVEFRRLEVRPVRIL